MASMLSKKRSYEEAFDDEDIYESPRKRFHAMDVIDLTGDDDSVIDLTGDDDNSPIPPNKSWFHLLPPVCSQNNHNLPQQNPALPGEIQQNPAEKGEISTGARINPGARIQLSTKLEADEYDERLSNMNKQQEPNLLIPDHFDESTPFGEYFKLIPTSILPIISTTNYQIGMKETLDVIQGSTTSTSRQRKQQHLPRKLAFWRRHSYRDRPRRVLYDQNMAKEIFIPIKCDDCGKLQSIHHDFHMAKYIFKADMQDEMVRYIFKKQVSRFCSCLDQNQTFRELSNRVDGMPIRNSNEYDHFCAWHDVLIQM